MRHSWLHATLDGEFIMPLRNKVCLVTGRDAAEGTKVLVIVREGGEEAFTHHGPHGSDASLLRHASVR
jgi:hypothetical protein